MNKPVDGKLLSNADAYGAWEQEYAATIGKDKQVINRSGVPIQPLYTARDWNPAERSD